MSGIRNPKRRHRDQRAHRPDGERDHRPFRLIALEPSRMDRADREDGNYDAHERRGLLREQREKHPPARKRRVSEAKRPWASDRGDGKEREERGEELHASRHRRYDVGVNGEEPEGEDCEQPPPLAERPPAPRPQEAFERDKEGGVETRFVR